jgi:hypothetical protein
MIGVEACGLHQQLPWIALHLTPFRTPYLRPWLIAAVRQERQHAPVA